MCQPIARPPCLSHLGEGGFTLSATQRLTAVCNKHRQTDIKTDRPLFRVHRLNHSCTSDQCITATQTQTNSRNSFITAYFRGGGVPSIYTHTTGEKSPPYTHTFWENTTPCTHTQVGNNNSGCGILSYCGMKEEGRKVANKKWKDLHPPVQ